MNKIGGNIKLIFQVKKETGKDKIGTPVLEWADVQTLKGWLDFMAGGARYGQYNAKIEDSTHIFLSDFEPLDKRIKAETARAIINGEIYDIKLIDNPMQMNKHYEIYLKYTGGQ